MRLYPVKLIKYFLFILIIFLLGGIFNVDNFTDSIEKESIHIVEQYFNRKGSSIKHNNMDISLGQVEINIATEKTKYFLVIQVKNYWIISTILSYFIKPNIYIQSIQETYDLGHPSNSGTKTAING